MSRRETSSNYDDWLGVSDYDGQSRHGDSRVGIYGWRKRCLYCLLAILLIMIIINLALTLWILKVMDLSTEGMGSLKIVNNGIHLDGEAYLLDRLVASSIRSRAGKSLTFESARNLTIFARKSDARVANKLFLGDGKLECEAASFKITSPLGKELFSADQRQVHVGAATLRVSGEGGAVFDGSIQTPLVRAEARHELRLESPTRSVEVTAAEGIALESRAGDIAATCLTELRLTSKEGAIYLNSGNIMLPKLPIVNVSTSESKRTNAVVYQMCICGDGKIFMIPPSWECVADARICS